LLYASPTPSNFALFLLPSPLTHTNRQALNYPEVQARKCLVKNVLREEDLVR
jgi:hypothetical protein